VECLSDADCRKEDTDSALPEKLKSPLGICTSEKVCTCWVDTPKGFCGSADDCPSGYVCAEDLSGKGHFVCLRECSQSVAPVHGIACEQRAKLPKYDKTYVWAPKTTCYAFDRFGADCSSNGLPDPSKCRIEMVNGGQCQEFGTTYKCTYSCWDGSASVDSWCPTWPEDTDACDNSTNTCKQP
jgi:hypothetical protein